MNETQIARWSPARGRALDLTGCRWWTGIGCFASVPLLSFVLLAVTFGGWPAEYLYPALALPVVLAFAPSIFRAFRSQAEMRHFDADVGEVPVEVVVSLADPGVGAGAWSLGRDEGMLCHESGWLVFRGRRSEWSVRATPGKSIKETGFRFKPPAGAEREVAFVGIDHDGRVRAVIGEWIRAPVPSGLEMLPPITVAPGWDRRAPIWTWAIPCAVGLLFLVAQRASADPPATLLIFGTIFLIALVGTLTAARIRLQALRRAGAIA